MKTLRLIKNLLRVELFLAIILLLTPILLPLTSDEDLLESISAYAYAINSNLYSVLLVMIGYLIMVDGTSNKLRRYNILLGIFLIGVILFPVLEWRWTHDIFAMLFFIGNVYVIGYYSKALTKFGKDVFRIVVALGILLFLFGYISLFIIESIGFFSLSTFMFIRFLGEWESTEKEK